MRPRPLFIGLMTATAASAIATAALADPPERVGRVVYVEGDVSLQPPQTGYWSTAAQNYPVAPGEAFWTGDDGRVELQLGFIAARLDNQTELDVVDTDYGSTRLALSQGSLSVRLRRDPGTPLSISTPAGDIHLDREGLYRIDVGEQGDDGYYPQVEVTVFEGQADAPGAEGPVEIDGGGAAVMNAGLDPEIQNAQDASIDDWARDREAIERWRPTPDIGAEMTGFEDLDAAGDFVVDAQYGRVWFPRDVPVDWAPYRFGHWAWVAPWGYTWIDDQPWGFAPFHYGRWARFGDRWGWVPGRPERRPVYAPALVAFVGGGGFSASLNLGGAVAIGWAPLAPEEVYRPPYQVNAAYLRRVNVTSVSNVSITRAINQTTVNTITIDTYKNASGLTVARADAVALGAPVRGASIKVSAEVLAHAPVSDMRASLPPPALEVRAGTGSGEHGVVQAPPPPAKLLAVRQAVRYQPPGASKPPVIAGAKLSPVRPAVGGALIGPAQVRHPAAQGRQPVVAPTQPSMAKTSPMNPAGAKPATVAPPKPGPGPAQSKPVASKAQSPSSTPSQSRPKPASTAMPSPVANGSATTTPAKPAPPKPKTKPQATKPNTPDAPAP